MASKKWLAYNDLVGIARKTSDGQVGSSVVALMANLFRLSAAQFKCVSCRKYPARCTCIRNGYHDADGNWRHRAMDGGRRNKGDVSGWKISLESLLAVSEEDRALLTDSARHCYHRIVDLVEADIV